MFDFHTISLYYAKAKFVNMEVGAHILVRGMVQGVGFRYFVYRKAIELGVRGYACNRGDGSVEIEAVADRSLVEELIREVTVGPRAARVTDVQVEWKQPVQQYHEFEIR